MAQLQVLNACEIGGSITIVINDDWTSYEREKILDSFTIACYLLNLLGSRLMIFVFLGVGQRLHMIVFTRGGLGVTIDFNHALQVFFFGLSGNGRTILD